VPRLSHASYINRNGRDVSIASIAKAVWTVFRLDPATAAAVGGGVLVLDRHPGQLPGAAPGAPAVKSAAGPLAFGSLGELFAPGRTFYDASFTRDGERRPAHPRSERAPFPPVRAEGRGQRPVPARPT
jgi:hypothetical protein